MLSREVTAVVYEIASVSCQEKANDVHARIGVGDKLFACKEMRSLREDVIEQEHE